MPGFGAQARADRVCAAVSAMCDIGPRDTLEGMLAAQMIAVHSAALDSLRRAAEPAADLRHAARLLSVFQRQIWVRDDRRNPVLARSLTGRHDPDAPGRSPGARVAPARKMFRERTCLTGRTAGRDGVSGCGKGRCDAVGCGLPRYRVHGGTIGSGAPRGSCNALRDGFHTASAPAGTVRSVAKLPETE